MVQQQMYSLAALAQRDASDPFATPMPAAPPTPPPTAPPTEPAPAPVEMAFDYATVRRELRLRYSRVA